MNEYEEGKVLLLDKPYKWTSFDVIQKLRKVLKIRKIGHCGTLDPLATGLLIVCTGKFTKRINEYMAQEKEYLATYTLGSSTPTYDLESEPVAVGSVENITQIIIEKAIEQFKGDIMQIPPAHSAIKVDGKRLYELARQGKEVKIEPRKVTVKEYTIISYLPPLLTVKIVCGTGTYIRSLANDLGAVLGCGAHLSALCRTRIGDFKVEEATSIEEIQKAVDLLKDKGIANA